MPQKESVERVKTDLEIEEHLPMQERGWKAQAIGLYFILAMVATASAGLYGDGPISKKKSTENTTTVEHQRFYRFQSRMELKVELNNSSKTNGATVAFPAKYLEHFQVDSILPEPEKNVVDGDHVIYYFDGSGNFTITFFLIPRSIGAIDGSIAVDKSHFELKHFIFP